ncbi:flagellar hook-associated protein K [Fulvimarina pelagi HTCC2506]|uniref:Flagellar hook-associated protein 1 n=2 Tax=Fulvimarina pelagi TaxID=217511 RepID=Q0G1D9_9HYPH|nr:flagellar hook-associated protein FlgK [Fulvimarina pelagi]EAU41142.1 flagellar hook-associated protein K [Fulvimarina pelagi HTCC2506]BAT30843.1 flagellar hook-associated protein K [Fulvimarina pelagi]
MSLLSVFNNARSSLSVTSQQSALVARNVANADDPTATRKYASQVSERLGAVDIRAISQSSDPALYRSLISAQASLGTNETLAEALDRVRDVIGDVDASTSPSASIAALKDALTDLAASPENSQLQRTAVDAARSLATNLNNATMSVQTMRADADRELDEGAKRLNELLSQLETLNSKVVAGTATGADVTDEVDQRDRIVSEISSYVGVSVRLRANNDLVLSTDSGIVMFETRARSVEFTRTQSFDPSIRLDSAVAANRPGEFKIDGVSIGGTSSMAVRDGSLVAALKLRDEVGVEFQNRLDQTGDTLVNETFAENGAPGLYERTGPATIAIAASVDYRIGGNPALIRDGGINGSPTFNTAGESGFADRLNALVARFSDQHTFANGELGTLGDFTASSMAWFEGRRATASKDASYQSIMVTRARDTLSNKTGINLDDEMSHLLELERTYQASTKLVQTVGELLDRLLAIR